MIPQFTNVTVQQYLMSYRLAYATGRGGQAMVIKMQPPCQVQQLRPLRVEWTVSSSSGDVFDPFGRATKPNSHGNGMVGG